MIQLKRVYERPSPRDGARFLVERLWPRGIKKQDLPLDAWAKDVAPSAPLRQWYAHDVAKWTEFKRRYRSELRSNAEALEPLLKASRRGNVTLLYSAHDQEHNSAVLLKTYLERRLKTGRKT